MKRIAFFLYGAMRYAATVTALLYTAGLIANIGVSEFIDAEPIMAVSLGLLGIFAVQRSVMARQAFKRHWTKLVSPVIERSTYCLISAAALFLLMWKREPMGGVVWKG